VEVPRSEAKEGKKKLRQHWHSNGAKTELLQG